MAKKHKKHEVIPLIPSTSNPLYMQVRKKGAAVDPKELKRGRQELDEMLAKEDKFFGDVEVYPGLAVACLERMGPNRKLSVHHLNRLTAELTDGRWENDGNPAKFDSNNVFIDAQHRFAAVINTGIAVRCDFRMRLSPKAFELVDSSGKNRSIGDILSIAGYTDPTILSSTLKLICAFDTHEAAGQSLISWHQGNMPWSAKRAIEIVRAHPEIMESVKWGRQLRHSFLNATPHVTAAMHFIFSRLDKEDADKMLQKLVTGKGFVAGEEDPVHHLYLLLQSNAMESPATRRDRYEIAASFIKAWNSLQSKRCQKDLNWRRPTKSEKVDGRHQEAFPKLGSIPRIAARTAISH